MTLSLSRDITDKPSTVTLIWSTMTWNGQTSRLKMWASKSIEWWPCPRQFFLSLEIAWWKTHMIMVKINCGFLDEHLFVYKKSFFKRLRLLWASLVHHFIFYFSIFLSFLDSSCQADKPNTLAPESGLSSFYSYLHQYYIIFATSTTVSSKI